MRTLILVATLAIGSAAHAGDRGLTVGSSQPPAAAQPATGDGKVVTAAPAKIAEAAVDAPAAADAPKYVERPAAVQPTPAAQPAKVETAKPPTAQTASASRAEKPRRKRYWNEARIINELHRHGIYW